MRGPDGQTGTMFSYVDLEERIPAGHPLHKIHEFVNAALTVLDWSSPGFLPPMAALRLPRSGCYARR